MCWESFIRADEFEKTEVESRYKEPLPKRNVSSRKLVSKNTDTIPVKRVTVERVTVERENDEIIGTVKAQSQEEIEAMFPPQAVQDSKELDPLTSKLLEYELRHIMIKVWQVFPDDPDTDDVKIVTEKFRNEAGDDLRNVIGLNVTKRLLNVHNKLIVKVRFSCRPEKENLLAFLKKYRITGFKRITSATNTFAAQLKNIDDFDKICSVKEITCGKAKISITPCYNFMKRPPHLKTKFVDDTDDEKADEPQEIQKAKEDIEIKQKIEGKYAQEGKDKIKTKTTSQEIEVKCEQKLKPASKTSTNENTEIGKTSLKDFNAEPAMKAPAANERVSKTADKVLNTSAPQGTSQPTENKTADTKIVPKGKPGISKKEDKPESAINVKTKTTETPNRPDNSTKVSKLTTESGKPAKVQAKNITPLKKSKLKSANRMHSKLVSRGKMHKSITKDIINKYNDYDEMNDEDIVALLTDTVLRDECGSDDE